MKHKQTTFKNLELYNGLKAVLGFNQSMLEASYRLIEEALRTQRKPKGVHMLIEQPNSQFPNLRMKLNRWAENRGLGTPLFMWCKEIRPKTKKEHCHLHIIADGLTYKDIVFLEDSLKTLGKSVKCFTRANERVDPETGEIIKDGSSWYHDLRSNLSDYFERFSYISKLYSKPVKGRYAKHLTQTEILELIHEAFFSMHRNGLIKSFKRNSKKIVGNYREDWQDYETPHMALSLETYGEILQWFSYSLKKRSKEWALSQNKNPVTFSMPRPLGQKTGKGRKRAVVHRVAQIGSIYSLRASVKRSITGLVRGARYGW